VGVKSKVHSRTIPDIGVAFVERDNILSTGAESVNVLGWKSMNIIPTADRALSSPKNASASEGKQKAYAYSPPFCPNRGQRLMGRL